MAYRKFEDLIWKKGDKVPGKDPNKYRMDISGNIIHYNSYGKNSPMGLGNRPF